MSQSLSMSSDSGTQRTLFTPFKDYVFTTKEILRAIRIMFKFFRVTATISFLILIILDIVQEGFFELKYIYDIILFIALLTAIIDIMIFGVELLLCIFKREIHKSDSYKQQQLLQQLEKNETSQLEMNQHSRGRKMVMVEMIFSVLLFLIYFGLSLTITALYGFFSGDDDSTETVRNGLIWIIAFCWFFYFIFTYLEYR
ncbi:24803_t:CDS:1 [Cetraspora pellucida]|uniref:24803_t:CDS:1 n=1 Tax=Cetraspora pellucida TaxID=1433469 RepID=A0A9N9A0F6_9GLOM|nr:24803_t:CDS:1 [Cetraspora pellucida]